MAEDLERRKAELAALTRLIHDCSFKMMSQVLEEGLDNQVLEFIDLSERLSSLPREPDGSLSTLAIATAYAMTLKELTKLELFRWKFELLACVARIHLQGDDLSIPLFLIRLNELIRQDDDDCREISKLLTPVDRANIDWHRQWEAHIAPDGQFPDLALINGTRARKTSKAKTSVISLPPRRPFGRDLAKRIWDLFGEDDLRQLRDLIKRYLELE